MGASMFSSRVCSGSGPSSSLKSRPKVARAWFNPDLQASVQAHAPLRFLFELNVSLSEREAAMQPITGPGLPKAYAEVDELFSDDAVSMPVAIRSPS